MNALYIEYEVTTDNYDVCMSMYVVYAFMEDDTCPGGIYTNLPKVFVQHKITLVVNVPLWTNIKSGAMMGIEIYKYRKHTVLALSLVKI